MMSKSTSLLTGIDVAQFKCMKANGLMRPGIQTVCAGGKGAGKTSFLLSRSNTSNVPQAFE